MIPATMRAVQVEAPGAQAQLAERPVPRPGPGEVLVRMAAAPINPSDVNFLAGAEDPGRAFPMAPGFEGSGTVVGAGGGLLGRFLLGRRVFAAAPAGGAWAEYLVAPARLCIPLGRHLSLEQGAMLLVNPMTAWAIFDIARRGKHRALINTAAAGALGRMIARLGRRRGIDVINVVRRPEQVDLVRGLGERYVLDSGAADFRDQLRALAERLQATLALDAVAGDMTSHLAAATPAGSTILVYGILSKEPSRLDPLALIAEDKRLRGFWLRSWMAARGPVLTLRDVRAVRRLAPDTLSSAVQLRAPLSSVREALAAHARGTTSGKVLLVADPSAVPLPAPQPAGVGTTPREVEAGCP